MKDLQKRAARALLALLQNDPKAALDELNVYKLTLEDGEPILMPNLREDRPLGPAHPLEGQEVWAIGIEHKPGEFGMTHGPFRTLHEATTTYPWNDPHGISDLSRIIHFFGDGREEVTHRWVAVDGAWLQLDAPRPKINPFEEKV